MPVTYIARYEGLPAGSPSSQFAGYTAITGVSGTRGDNIYSNVIADIGANINATGWSYAYSVVWSARYNITSAIPRSISAFAGNPERRYVGVATVGTLQSNYETIQLNYLNQGLRRYQFMIANTLGQRQFLADIPIQAVTSPNRLVTPYYNPPTAFAGPSNFPAFDYADVLRTFLFPGLVANIFIGWVATLIHADNNVTADIGISL